MTEHIIEEGQRGLHAFWPDADGWVAVVNSDGLFSDYPVPLDVAEALIAAWRAKEQRAESA